nr:MAG TPA: hypothetical protein [Caudoviricetes sp.]
MKKENCFGEASIIGDPKKNIKLELRNSSVSTEKLKDKAVSTDKLADNSVTNSKMLNSSVTNSKLADNTITSTKLEPGLRNTIASTYDKTIELDNQKANIADVDNAIERLENKIGERFIVEGDVTNLPDEEDLTSVSTIDGREVMKLNDRAYEPSNFSGKGYKILRKNIKKFDIPTVNIVVSYAPTSSGNISITVNDKVITINLDSTTDTTPAIVATKIAAALKSSLDDYNVSVSSNRITLTRHNVSSVFPVSINVSNTSAVISVNDSITKNVRKNILTQDMINDPNTIYEIKYDFDLNNADIIIRDNSVLYFNGGKLLNGSWKYSSKVNSIIKATQIGFIEGTSEKIANFNGALLQNLMTANIGIDFENKEYNFNILRSVPCNFIYIKGGTLNMNVNPSCIFIGLDNSTDKPIIHIENTIINNVGNNKNAYLIRASNLDFYYNYCLLKKCTFNNFLSIRLEFGDFDSNIHKVGVSTTIIEDCIFKDLEGTFYLCNDAYYNSVIIRGNTIKNNKYSVFCFATTNEYESSANIDRCGKFIFENNNHVNDSDFLSTPNRYTYICTVLVEGNEVYFNNNTFENIRAFNSLVYAFYVSSIYFKCTNNIIKNVFNFNQCTHPIVELSYGNCHNEIFKSKGGKNLWLILIYVLLIIILLL